MEAFFVFPLLSVCALSALLPCCQPDTVGKKDFVYYFSFYYFLLWSYCIFGLELLGVSNYFGHAGCP